MLSKVVRLNNDTIGEVVQRIEELYHEGQIEGVVIGIKLKNGNFVSGFTHTISFLEQLGLCQALINDIQYHANFAE